MSESKKQPGAAPPDFSELRFGCVSNVAVLAAVDESGVEEVFVLLTVQEENIAVLVPCKSVELARLATAALETAARAEVVPLPPAVVVNGRAFVVDGEPN